MKTYEEAVTTRKGISFSSESSLRISISRS